MTYKPIPESRRRRLAPHVPKLVRKLKPWLGAPTTGESERDFWQRELPGVSPDELVWLIRQAHNAAGCTDPVQITNYKWPGRCDLTGPQAAREHWPLEPIPGEPQAQPTPEGPLVDGTPVKEGDVLYYVGGYKPFIGAEIIAGKPKSKTRVWVEGFYCPDGRWIDPGTMHASGLSRTKPVIMEAERNRSQFVNRIPGVELEGATHDARTFLVPQFTNLMLDLETMRPGQIDFDPKPVSRKFFDPAVLSTSTKEKHTMNQATSVAKATSAAQATPFNHASLSVDTSKIVEVKTFVYGTDIATLNDDTLLNYTQSLTDAIEHLERLNAKTPLAKLVTKIAQLKDAKAKIVDLLGGAPVQADSDGGTNAGPLVEAQPRKRRTKAEMEAGAQGGTAPQAPSKPVPPAPPAQPEPSVADVDLDD